MIFATPAFAIHDNDNDAVTDNALEAEAMTSEMIEQTKNQNRATAEEKQQAVKDALLNPSEENTVHAIGAVANMENLDSRVAAAKAAVEQVKLAKTYIKSLADLTKGTISNFPIGFGSEDDDYMLAITRIETIENNGNEETWIYVAAHITFRETGKDKNKNKNEDDKNAKSISFDGKAKIEGLNGMGTNGYLTLIKEVDRPIGKSCSLSFLEGTTLHFGCNGFEDILAKLRLTVTNSSIYAIDASGKSKGQLTTEMETTIKSLNDFTVGVNFADRFAIKGLDGFKFTLRQAQFDHSFTATPAAIRFPSGYVSSEDARKEWRGVAISEAKIEMPPYMKSDGTSGEPMSVDMSNMLIDGNGLTCATTVNDMSHGKTLNTSSWQVAADNFSLEILKNDIVSAYFDGRISIPPLETVNDFSALYNHEARTFLFTSTFGKDLSFEMLKAKLELYKTSTIELKIANNDIQPAINLNGRLSIDVPMPEDATFALDIPDLAFEQMHISKDKFDLGRISLEGDASAKLGGFEMNFKNIKSNSNGDSHSLSFDAEVKVAEKFKGDTRIKLSGDSKRFKFKQVDVEKINLEFKSGAVSIGGGVEIIKGDGIYGKGFRGELKMKIAESIGIDAVGVFGKKDDFRYFMADALYTDNSYTGITISALNIYGLGGGLYHHMRQNDGDNTSSFGKSLSGVNYVPDRKIGFGFTSTAKLCLMKSPRLFDADVNFEMQFTTDWGVKFVQLRGDAAMFNIETPAKEDELTTLSKKLAAANEEAGNTIRQATKNDIENIVPKKPGMIRGAFLMKYDVANKTFNADMSSYINFLEVVKGTGPNDRMGWASAMISPSKKYLYIGTPDAPNGLSVLNVLSSEGYFMLGDDMPSLPDVPDNVRRLLKDKYKKSERTDYSKLGNGSGVAFGLSAGAHVSVNPVPFYATLGAEVGTEFLLKHYSAEAHCEGYDAPIGANGWYAQAQAWLWAKADVGIRVRLFKKDRKFSILSSEVAAYLQGGGPRPVYFKGALGGEFKVLNGLVKGKYSIGFSIGEECKMVGGSPFGEDVISQITPAEGSKDVNVFVAPQLVLNVPADEEMQIEEEDGRINIFRVRVAEFYVQNTNNNSKPLFTPSRSSDGRIITYESNDPLESQKNYKIYAKVTFEQKIGGVWKPYTESDGSVYYEEKLVEFTSGDRPKNIEKQFIAYAYPADRQYNFLPDEYKEKTAYFLIKKNFGYLFNEERPEGFRQEVQLTSFGGRTQSVGFTYKTTNNTPGYCFEIDIPTKDIKFSNDEIYNLAIVNVPIRTAKKDENIHTYDKELTDLKINDDTEVSETVHSAEGDLALLEQTEILSIDFRTSSYNTFKEKMDKMNVGSIVAWQEYPYVYNLKTNIIDNSAHTENFDFTEYDNDSDKGNIKIKPIYSQTPWYVNNTSPLMYGNTDLRNLIGNIQPPTHAEVMYWYNSSDFTKLVDNDIETNARLSVSAWNTINNHMQYYMDKDLADFRTKVSDKLAKGATKTAGVQRFLNADNIPPTETGNYPILFQYTLPGKNVVTSEYQVNTYLK